MVKTARWLILIVFLVGWPGVSQAADTSTTTFALEDNASNEVVIRGQSTVNHWSCKTNDIDARFHFFATRAQLTDYVDQLSSDSVSLNTSAAPGLPTEKRPQVRLSLPIKSFDCGKKAMNEDMYEALKADAYPKLSYMFYSIRDVTVRNHKRNTSYEIKTDGGLALGGKAQTMQFPVRVQRTDDLSFRIEGTIDVKMTDFGVKPPTALFGLIKAYDDITIDFKLHLSPSQSPPSLSTPDELLSEDVSHTESADEES